MRYRKPMASSSIAAPVFSSLESAAPDAIRALQDRKLREQIAYLANRSAFYRRKFANAGFSIESVLTAADLAAAPFTTKAELRESLAEAPPLGLHLAADLKDVVQIQASSGTTGSPSYVGLTEADVLAWQEVTARALFACGMRPHDLVLHAFSMSKGFVGGVPIFQATQYLGAVDIPIGADGGVERLLIAARDLRPACVVGTPNFLLHLADVARDAIGMEVSELGVRRLIVGGEPGGGIPAIRRELEARWNALCCELLGGTDLGCTYWAESDDQTGMQLVGPDHILVELIDPESEVPLRFEDGATGELVYTALGREASPVFRFRSGDHVLVTAADPGNGRTGPAIRCVGRTDDMLIVRGVNVFPSAIQDLIAGDPDTNGVVRILADFEGHSTQSNLKLLVERAPGRPESRDPELKESIERRVRDALAVKADVTVTPAGFFQKPGAQKVALTLRTRPDGLALAGENDE